MYSRDDAANFRTLPSSSSKGTLCIAPKLHQPIAAATTCQHSTMIRLCKIGSLSSDVTRLQRCCMYPARDRSALLSKDACTIRPYSQACSPQWCHVRCPDPAQPTCRWSSESRRQHAAVRQTGDQAQHLLSAPCNTWKCGPLKSPSTFGSSTCL